MTYTWNTVSKVVLASFGILALKKYMNGGVCRSPVRLDGKVAIVTGANAGIGKETVAELVKRGGKVYLACRSVERARLAVDALKKATGADESQLIILQLDLGSLESIRSFVKEFKQSTAVSVGSCKNTLCGAGEEKLDILVNNAGLLTYKYETTVDGFEATFGANYLGPFLLTHLLTECLVAPGGKSRVVNVASRAHRRGTLDFDDVMMKKDYRGFIAYSQSKLANILFSRELARRYGSSVSVYSLHPGLIGTNLFQEMTGISGSPFLLSLFHLITWPFMKDPWHGAQTSIYCAVDESLESQSGKYYSDCAEKEPFPVALDDTAAGKLWDLSVELLKLDKSDVHPLLR